MYSVSESSHVRDRRFEIILEVLPVVGTVLTGGHPGCVNEMIRVNLRAAAEKREPVLSGSLMEGAWMDAWMEDGTVRSEKERCLVYSGHIFERITDEEAESALNRLAINLGRYLQSPKIRLAIGDKFWVLTKQPEEELSQTA